MQIQHHSYNPIATGLVERNMLRLKEMEKEAHAFVPGPISSDDLDDKAPNPFDGFDFARAFEQETFEAAPVEVTVLEYAFATAKVEGGAS